VPNVDLPPLCSPMFKPGPPGPQAQVLSTMMLDVLSNSQCLKPKKEKKPSLLARCWPVILRCYFYFFQALFFFLGLQICVCSLCVASCNRVSTAEGKVDVLLEREAVGVSPGPLAASFAVLADDVVVADPTHEEECLAQETFTVVLAADDTLCTVHKPGGSFLSPEQMSDHLEQAQRLVKDSRTLLNTALATAPRP
ncbi:exosomal 3'-5' exoribonuclease complex, subunit Rrp43, putative, partial [Ixodes scapularis]